MPVVAFISLEFIIGETVPPPARKEHISALWATDFDGGNCTEPFNFAAFILTLLILLLYSE